MFGSAFRVLGFAGGDSLVYLDGYIAGLFLEDPTRETPMAAITWRKSSYSGGGNSDCVEIALSSATLIRDSKNPGPRLALPASAWRGLLAKAVAPAISI